MAAAVECDVDRGLEVVSSRCSLLMRAARFHRTVLRLLSAPFLIGARSHLLNTVVVRTRLQTERATDSAICSSRGQSAAVPERAAEAAPSHGTTCSSSASRRIARGARSRCTPRSPRTGRATSDVRRGPLVPRDLRHRASRGSRGPRPVCPHGQPGRVRPGNGHERSERGVAEVAGVVAIVLVTRPDQVPVSSSMILDAPAMRLSLFLGIAGEQRVGPLGWLSNGTGSNA